MCQGWRIFYIWRTSNFIVSSITLSGSVSLKIPYAFSNSFATLTISRARSTRQWSLWIFSWCSMKLARYSTCLSFKLQFIHVVNLYMLTEKRTSQEMRYISSTFNEIGAKRGWKGHTRIKSLSHSRIEHNFFMRCVQSLI